MVRAAVGTRHERPGDSAARDLHAVPRARRHPAEQDRRVAHGSVFGRHRWHADGLALRAPGRAGDWWGGPGHDRNDLCLSRRTNHAVVHGPLERGAT